MRPVVAVVVRLLISQSHLLCLRPLVQIVRQYDSRFHSEGQQYSAGLGLGWGLGLKTLD